MVLPTTTCRKGNIARRSRNHLDTGRQRLSFMSIVACSRPIDRNGKRPFLACAFTSSMVKSDGVAILDPSLFFRSHLVASKR